MRKLYDRIEWLQHRLHADPSIHELRWNAQYSISGTQAAFVHFWNKEKEIIENLRKNAGKFINL